MNVAGVFAFRGTQPWSLSDWLIDFDYEKKAVEWWNDPASTAIVQHVPENGQLNGTTEATRPKEPMVCAVPPVHKPVKTTWCHPVMQIDDGLLISIHTN